MSSVAVAAVHTDRVVQFNMGMQTPTEESYLPPGIDVARRLEEDFANTESCVCEIVLRFSRQQPMAFLTEQVAVMELVTYAMTEASVG